jgi:hypothetical protein
VNDRGVRVGEDHQRATLTDHDVELMRQLREEGIGYKRRVSTPTAWKTVQG